jgi:glutamate racemase
MISSININMDNPVLFLDSGLGGLPYCKLFHERNPGEKVICIADRANFPYGPKPREVLIQLLSSLAGKLVPLYDPKILALACNSASVSALNALREEFPNLPIVGTVPAVKPAVLASKNRKVGVLGTERTIEDPYIAELAAKYGGGCEIIGEAAPELVEFAEHRYASAGPAERLGAVQPWVDKFRSKGADAVVLGCTHFLLLLDEFRAAAGSTMGIFDSVEGVARRIESFLGPDSGKLRADDSEMPCLMVTGDAPLEPYWARLASCFGLKAELLK